MFPSARLSKVVAPRSLLSARSSIPPASRALSTQPLRSTRNQSQSNGRPWSQNYRDPKDFNSVFYQASKFKARKDDRPLTVQRYYGLMDALAANELYDEALALIDDMDACGVAPDTRLYNLALKACANNPKRFRELIERIEKENVPWDGVTYSRMIHHRVRDGEIELALQDFHAMIKAGFSFPRHIAERFATSAAKADHPRLALDLMKVYEAGSQDKVQTAPWVETLSKSVELYYDEGIRTCLERLKKDEVSLDEGLTTELLLYSARVADLGLAESMLTHLEKLGVQLQEQHLAPFLEIYVKKDNLDGVFATFERMTNAGIKPTNRAAQCLAQGLTEKKSQATLLKVYDALESFKQSGKVIPTALLNAVLEGNLWCADKVDWWITLYDNLKSYNTSPNIRTFNALLHLCTITKDEPLSQRIYDDLMTRSADAAVSASSSAPKPRIKPDAFTYKYLSLTAVQQKSYEAAFHWLEETKSAGFVPTVENYVLLIRRCGWKNDNRWKPALEEMKAQGYHTMAVERFLRSKGILPGKDGQERQRRQSEGAEETVHKMDRPVYRRPRKGVREAKM
ncbi:hypothetical protein FRC04_012286 [Tulasnella sp. 424]|nr:hypothetical protein FRC04_012286 [Tulasnella sp. 424]KAG8970891.1 hypothetical protein FRC05_011659 [Tulasnella sp. 425]